MAVFLSTETLESLQPPPETPPPPRPQLGTLQPPNDFQLQGAPQEVPSSNWDDNGGVIGPQAPPQPEQPGPFDRIGGMFGTAFDRFGTIARAATNAVPEGVRDVAGNVGNFGKDYAGELASMGSSGITKGLNLFGGPYGGEGYWGTDAQGQSVGAGDYLRQSVEAHAGRPGVAAYDIADRLASPFTLGMLGGPAAGAAIVSPFTGVGAREAVRAAGAPDWVQSGADIVGSGAPFATGAVRGLAGRFGGTSVRPPGDLPEVSGTSPAVEPGAAALPPQVLSRAEQMAQTRAEYAARNAVPPTLYEQLNAARTDLEQVAMQAARTSRGAALDAATQDLLAQKRTVVRDLEAQVQAGEPLDPYATPAEVLERHDASAEALRLQRQQAQADELRGTVGGVRPVQRGTGILSAENEAAVAAAQPFGLTPEEIAAKRAQHYGGQTPPGRTPMTEAERAGRPDSYRQTSTLATDLINAEDLPPGSADVLRRQIDERLGALPRTAAGDVRRNQVTATEQENIGQLMAARRMREALDAHPDDPLEALAELEQHWKDAGQALEIRDTPGMRARYQNYASLRSQMAATGVSPNLPLPVLRAYNDALDTIMSTARFDPSSWKTVRSPEQMSEAIKAAYQRSIGDTTPVDPLATYRDPASNLIQRIADAKPLQEQNKELLSKFRSRQAGAFSGAIENGPRGEAGFNNALGAMRGQAERVSFQPLRDVIPEQQVNALFDAVTSSHLRPFEQANAGQALRDILDGQVPAPSSLVQLEQVFPGVIRALRSANIMPKGPLLRVPTMAEINNTIRGSNTLFDYAALGRLGPQAGLYDPEAFSNAWVNGYVKAVKDPSVIREALAQIDAAAPVAIQDWRAVGLRMHNPDADPGLLGKIPGLSRIVNGYRNFQTLIKPQMANNELEMRIAAGDLPASAIRDQATLAEIAKGTNVVSGSTNLPISEDANFLFRFPNWLAAQYEILGRAAIAPARPNISNQMALKSVSRLITFGIGTTAAINALQPDRPTQFRNGVPMANIPDFITEHLGMPKGTTIDLFGPLGEVVSRTAGIGVSVVHGAQQGGVSGAGKGAAKGLYQLYNSLAAPLIGIGLGLAVGHDAFGNPTRSPDWVVGQVAPFASDVLLGTDTRSRATQVASSGGFRLHEPSASKQLTNRVNEQFPNQPYGVEPYMLDAARKANPDLADEALGRARQQTQAAVQAKDESKQRQQGFDDQLAQTKNVTAWKDAYTNEQHYLAGQLNEIYRGSTPPAVDPLKPWQVYQQAVSDATDPKSRAVDWAKVDAVYRGMNNDQQAAVDRNLGLNSTPARTEYRAIGKQLETAGYFQIAKDDWAKAQQQAHVSGEYPTYYDWKNATEAKIAANLARGGHLVPAEAAKIAAQEVNALPASQFYLTVTKAKEVQWFAQHVHSGLPAKAVQWGYIRTPTTAEVGMLQAAGGGQ